MRLSFNLKKKQFPAFPDFSSNNVRILFEQSLKEENENFQVGTRALDCGQTSLPRHTSRLGENEIEFQFRKLGWKTERKNIFQFDGSLPPELPKFFNEQFENLLIEFNHSSVPGKSIFVFYSKLFDPTSGFHCGNCIRSVYFRFDESQPFVEWNDWSDDELFLPQLEELASRLISPNEATSVTSIAVAPPGSRLCLSCNFVRFKKDFSSYQWKTKRNRCFQCTGGKSEKSQIQIDSEVKSDESAAEEIIDECIICLTESSSDESPLVSFCGHSRHLLHSSCMRDWKFHVGGELFICPICRALPSKIE